jgi:hypothetical protein
MAVSANNSGGVPQREPRPGFKKLKGNALLCFYFIAVLVAMTGWLFFIGWAVWHTAIWLIN